jgi:hypothetical protein
VTLRNSKRNHLLLLTLDDECPEFEELFVRVLQCCKASLATSEMNFCEAIEIKRTLKIVNSKIQREGVSLEEK